MYNQAEYNTLITVITPVYNTGILLYETYASLQKQTWNDFLWILVNDGSDDYETNNILDRLSKTDKRVQVIRHEENRGLPASRNTGIQQAKSRYLFFLDADDLIHPTFLEKAYLFLETHTEYKFVNSWVVGFGAQQYNWTGGFHDREHFLKENRNTSCFMSRREVFGSVLFDETMRNGCEDWDFWLHAASLNYWGYTIPEYLFYYRRTFNKNWEDLQSPARLGIMREKLNAKYAAILKERGFPQPQQLQYEFGKIALPPVSLPLIQNGENIPGTILCLFPWLEMGGADLFNLRLIKELSKKGWKIIVLTTLESKQALSHAFEDSTAHVFHLANLGSTIYYNAWVRYFIETRKPDTIFLSNSMYGYYLLPWLKIQYPHIPVVDYVHCVDPGWYNGGYPFFSATYTNCLDKSFVSSKELGGWCIGMGADSSKVETCYINVDTQHVKRDSDKREAIRKQLNLKADSCLILYVARLTAQKQPGMVADVIAKISDVHCDFKCVIIGDGPERSALVNSIKKHKLGERVLLLGSQENDVVLDYMDAADIFFLPSLYEGIALSIYEAMAKSLAIVGADTGGQKELVTDACGILVKQATKEKESDEYARVLSDLLNSPVTISKMGKASRLRVEEKFSSPQMISQIHTALLNIKSQGVITTTANYSDEYMVLLNRLQYQEKNIDELYAKTNSRIFRVLEKNKRTVINVRKLYHKMKGMLHKISAR